METPMTCKSLPAKEPTTPLRKSLGILLKNHTRIATEASCKRLIADLGVIVGTS